MKQPLTRMRTWKTKIFANLRLNFYCTIVMGVVVIGGAARYLFGAIRLGIHTSGGLLLVAILFILFGLFGLRLTEYLESRAKVLEEQELAQRDEAKT